jgi:hypothetical protein
MQDGYLCGVPMGSKEEMRHSTKRRDRRAKKRIRLVLDHSDDDKPFRFSVGASFSISENRPVPCTVVQDSADRTGQCGQVLVCLLNLGPTEKLPIHVDRELFCRLNRIESGWWDSNPRQPAWETGGPSQGHGRGEEKWFSRIFAGSFMGSLLSVAGPPRQQSSPSPRGYRALSIGGDAA